MSSYIEPVGAIIWYGGDPDSLPSNALLCDGSAVSRTTYADLFAKISTTFGVGDGSTTFNLPNIVDTWVQGIATSTTSPGSTGGSVAKTTTAYTASGGMSDQQTIRAEAPASHTHSITDIRPKYIELTPVIIAFNEESFANIRAGVGNESNDDEASGKVVMLKATANTDTYDEMRRGILLFDTSGLPNNAIVTSATLKIYVNSVVDTLDDESINLVTATPASNSALAAGDYSLLETTEVSSAKNITDLTTSAFNTFTLNGAGESAINKKGVTKFGLRLSSDISGTAPTWGSGQEASVNIDFADGTNLPELTVNYDIGSDILGLHQFLDDAGGSFSQIVQSISGTLFYLDDDSLWQTLDATRTGTDKERFVNAIGRMFYTNPTDGMKTWNGNPASAPDTTQAVNAPAAKFLEYYKQKVYAFGTTTNPDRLFNSSLVSIGGNITWDVTNDFVEINTSDGEDGSGMRRWSTELLLFKPNQMYRYFGVAGVDPDPITTIGTYSHESVVPHDSGCYFHHPKGVYVYQGGRPERISQAIDDFMRNVSRANYTEVAGWEDGNHIYHSLGDITIGGVTFENIVSRFTISSQIWTLYSYPTQIKRGISYDDGSSIIPVVGDSNSTVYNFNQGNDDAGADIFYLLRTKWQELGGHLANEFTINKLASIQEQSDGMTLSWQKDDEDVNQWHPIAELNHFVWKSTKNLALRGHRVRFQIHGSSDGVPWIWNGIELLSGVVHQVGSKA